MSKAPNLRSNKEHYLAAFFIAFGLATILFLPFVIYDGGLFIYYGDYNVQQIPFYMNAHEAVQDGKLLWDWNTDLGANFIGSYSFYLLGSPFFWLTMPFPTAVLPFLMAPLFALKIATASLTAYAFCRRFTKTTNAALIAGLLYAFSGWSAYNIFFNHFHDVMAFFPLLLIALEETVVNKRRGVFALTVALCAIINYFFFAGQVVFVVIYFIIRCFCKDFKMTFSKFICVMLESIIGLGLSAFILLPSVLAVISNPRVDRYLTGWDMLFYNNMQRYGLIVQSFFFPPDIPARPNFFPDSNAKWASVAGFLPLFSMAGVIAFIKSKTKHWAKRLVIVCSIMALVPLLNSAFYVFNSSYYARWYYMPILVMAMMTAISLEDETIPLKSGIKWCGAAIAAFTVIGVLPKYVEKVIPAVSEGGSGVSGTSMDSSISETTTSVLEFGTLPADNIKFWVNVLIAIGCLLALIYLYLGRKKPGFFRRTIVMLCCAIFICTGSMMLFGRVLGPSTNRITEMALEATEWDLDPLDEGEWYRVDVYKGIDNNAMFWGLPTINTFHSVVPTSIMEFYTSINVERNVGSRADITYFALRGATSVKYLMFPNYSSEDEPELAGFELIGEQNNYKVYENKYFVPMGFTYDYYINDERWDSGVRNYRDRLLMKGVYLSDEQIERYGDILEPINQSITSDITKITYLDDCLKRAARTADTFTTTKNGFISTTSFDTDELVVYSVPFEDGWSATVNGEAVDVENVNHGFVAVRVPAGECTVEFSFLTPGLVDGIYITVGSAIILVVYLGLWMLLRKLFPKRFGVRRYAHLLEQEQLERVQANNAYIEQVSHKIGKFPEKAILSAWRTPEQSKLKKADGIVSSTPIVSIPTEPIAPVQRDIPTQQKSDIEAISGYKFKEFSAELDNILDSLNSLDKIDKNNNQDNENGGNTNEK